MRAQKTIAVFSGIISGLALILSLCLQSYSLWCNIFIGLFSSGILACIVAIITYLGERNRAIFALYNGCYDFLEVLSSNLSYNNMIDVRDLRKNFAAMIDTYMKDVYSHVCQLSIINKRSRLYSIVMDIWEPARQIYLRVSDDELKLREFFSQDITIDELKSYCWRYTSDESIHDMQSLKDALNKLMYHMNYYNVKKESKREVPDNAD